MNSLRSEVYCVNALPNILMNGCFKTFSLKITKQFASREMRNALEDSISDIHSCRNKTFSTSKVQPPPRKLEIFAHHIKWFCVGRVDVCK
jgi:hypothetical protein